MGLIGFELKCQCCYQIFFICKRHYRGHRYCSDLCRKDGYQRHRQQAKHRYNQKQKARRSNAKRQAAYRERQNSHKLTSASQKLKKNKITDQCSILNKNTVDPALCNASQIENRRRCRVCGEEIRVLVRFNERNKNS
jgi:hypothetical protein